MSGSTKIIYFDIIKKNKKRCFGQQRFSGFTFEIIYGKRKDWKEEII